MNQKDAWKSTGLGIAFGALAAGLTSLIVVLLRAPRRSAALARPAPRPSSAAPAGSLPHAAATAAGASEPDATLPGEPAPAAHAHNSTRWSSPTRYIVGVGMALFIVWLFWFSRASLSLIVLAALLAFILRPTVLGMQRRFKIGKGRAVLFTYLIVLAVLILVPVLLLPRIADSLNSLASMDWSNSAEQLAGRFDELAVTLDKIPVLGNLLANAAESFGQMITDLAQPTQALPAVDLSPQSAAASLSQTLGKLASVLGPLIGAIVSLVFMFLISLQMSLAADDMKAAYPRLFPERFRPEFNALADKLAVIWSSFLRGQITLMVVVGVMVTAFNWLVGTPYPLLLGIIAGFLEVIPSLGPLLAFIPAVIMALIFGSTRFVNMDPLVFAIIVGLGYGLIQGLENQVLVPYILGDAVNISPVAVLIGVTIAGSTIGLLGIFLVTPVIATGKEIMAYCYSKILEAPEAAPPPEEKRSLIDQARNLLSRIPNPFKRGKKAAGAEPDAEPAAEPLEAAQERAGENMSDQA